MNEEKRTMDAIGMFLSFKYVDEREIQARLMLIKCADILCRQYAAYYLRKQYANFGTSYPRPVLCFG